MRKQARAYRSRIKPGKPLTIDMDSTGHVQRGLQMEGVEFNYKNRIWSAVQHELAAEIIVRTCASLRVYSKDGTHYFMKLGDFPSKSSLSASDGPIPFFLQVLM